MMEAGGRYVVAEGDDEKAARILGVTLALPDGEETAFEGSMNCFPPEGP
jgi:hypothetical protein